GVAAALLARAARGGEQSEPDDERHGAQKPRPLVLRCHFRYLPLWTLWAFARPDRPRGADLTPRGSRASRFFGRPNPLLVSHGGARVGASSRAAPQAP